MNRIVLIEHELGDIDEVLSVFAAEPAWEAQIYNAYSPETATTMLENIKGFAPDLIVLDMLLDHDCSPDLPIQGFDVLQAMIDDENRYWDYVHKIAYSQFPEKGPNSLTEKYSRARAILEGVRERNPAIFDYLGKFRASSKEVMVFASELKRRAKKWFLMAEKQWRPHLSDAIDLQNELARRYRSGGELRLQGQFLRVQDSNDTAQGVFFESPVKSDQTTRVANCIVHPGAVNLRVPGGLKGPQKVYLRTLAHRESQIQTSNSLLLDPLE